MQLKERSRDACRTSSGPATGRDQHSVAERSNLFVLAKTIDTAISLAVQRARQKQLSRRHSSTALDSETPQRF